MQHGNEERARSNWGHDASAFGPLAWNDFSTDRGVDEHEATQKATRTEDAGALNWKKIEYYLLFSCSNGLKIEKYSTMWQETLQGRAWAGASPIEETTADVPSTRPCFAVGSAVARAHRAAPAAGGR